MIELEIRLTTDDTRLGFSLGDHSKEGEINTGWSARKSAVSRSIVKDLKMKMLRVS